MIANNGTYHDNGNVEEKKTVLIHSNELETSKIISFYANLITQKKQPLRMYLAVWKMFDCAAAAAASWYIVIHNTHMYTLRVWHLNCTFVHNNFRVCQRLFRFFFWFSIHSFVRLFWVFVLLFISSLCALVVSAQQLWRLYCAPSHQTNCIVFKCDAKTLVVLARMQWICVYLLIFFSPSNFSKFINDCSCVLFVAWLICCYFALHSFTELLLI